MNNIKTLKDLEDFGFFNYLKDTRIVVYRYSYPFPITSELFKENDHSKYILHFIECNENTMNIYVDLIED